MAYIRVLLISSWLFFFRFRIIIKHWININNGNSHENKFFKTKINKTKRWLIYCCYGLNRNYIVDRISTQIDSDTTFTSSTMTSTASSQKTTSEYDTTKQSPTHLSSVKSSSTTYSHSTIMTVRDSSTTESVLPSSTTESVLPSSTFYTSG